MKKLTINKKEYAVHFGLSSIINTGRELGYNDFNDLDKMFNGMASGKLNSITDAAHLFKAGIDRGCAKAGLTNDLSADDILDLITEDKAAWEVLQTELINSFQTGEEQKTATKKKLSHSPGTGLKKRH